MRLDHLLSKELLLLSSAVGRLVCLLLGWVVGLWFMPVPNVCRVVARGWNIDELALSGWSLLVLLGFLRGPGCGRWWPAGGVGDEHTVGS